MSRYPEKLAEMAGFFEAISDRSERIQLLIDIAERFPGVPKRIAKRPYPESHRVPECESQTYVWAEEQLSGTLKFYFAVENPHGVSTMAICVILDETLLGAPPKEVAAVPPEIIDEFFGEKLSLAKRMGLTAIVNRVRAHAQHYATWDESG